MVSSSTNGDIAGTNRGFNIIISRVVSELGDHLSLLGFSVLRGAAFEDAFQELDL